MTPPTLAKSLTGIYGILVTPFDAEDALKPELLQPIVDRAVDAGVHILGANGNTGEFYALSLDEAETMVRAITEQVENRVPVLAGIGRA